MPKPHIEYLWMTGLWWCEAYDSDGNPFGPMGMGDTPLDAYANWIDGVHHDYAKKHAIDSRREITWAK